MKTRLFHTIVVCGALLGCSGADDPAAEGEPAQGGAPADDDTGDPDPLERCVLPDGQCDEHCRYIGQGRCLDPCFVHSDTCRADCLLEDGSCGWHPTK